MTAATVHNCFVKPLYTERKSGTAGYMRGLQEVHVRAAFAAAADTINLATYVPGLTGVIGITYRSDDGVPGTAGFTISSTTLTEAAGATGVLEFGAIVY